jgi:hypothetical protein
MDSLLGMVPRKVSEEMNAMLEAPLTREEVRAALFQMFPTKAPGPNSYPARFLSYVKLYFVC